MKRALRSMPDSPNKRLIILQEMINTLLPKSKLKAVASPRFFRTKLLSTTTVLVQNFLESDDNSRVMPGRKDVRL